MKPSPTAAAVLAIGGMFLLPSPARADVSTEQWFIGPRLGFSPFTAILGLEAQKNHWALTVGIPDTIGAKYYFRIPRHSWFVGVSHNTYYSYVETRNNEYSKDTEFRQLGAGGGYRWRWGSGWDLSLDLVLGAGKESELNSPGRERKYIYVTPGLTFGYSF